MSKYPDENYPVDEKKRLFLEHYKNGLSIKSAAAAAEVKSHVTIYSWMKKDLDFKAKYEAIRSGVRNKVLGYVDDLLRSEPNPLLLKRLLDSKLFADTEYRAVRPEEYKSEEDNLEDEVITLDI